MSVVLVGDLPRNVQAQLLKRLVVKERFNPFGPAAVCNVFMKHTDGIRVPYSFGRKSGAYVKREFTRHDPWTINISLRDHQEKIVEECMKNYEETGCNRIQLDCGLGKTFTSLYLAQKICSTGKTLIVLPPDTLIRNGWIKCVKDKTTATVQTVGVDKLDDTAQIYITMKSSMRKLPDDIADQIEHIICDEAHLLCTQKSIDQLLRIRPNYITLLTATFEKKNNMHLSLELIAGTRHVSMVDQKKFKVFRFNTKFRPEIPSGDRIEWNAVQKSLEIIPERNEIITDLAIKSGLKTLILTRHVLHIELLKEMFNDKGVECSTLYGSDTSYTDSNIIISTFSKIGEGFDEENMCDTWNGKRLEMLIIAISKKDIHQNAGRVFRSENPVLIYLVDDDKRIQNHYKEASSFWTHEARNATVKVIDSVDDFK